MAYIYADMVNGNSIISADDIELPVDKCESMEDVRAYLRDMGLEDGEVFERVLEVPDTLVEQIDDEYGVKQAKK